MFNQIKSILLLLSLLSSNLLLPAQSTEIQEDTSKLDSLRLVITKQFNTKLLLQQKEFIRMMEGNESFLDSLSIKLEDQETQLKELLTSQEILTAELKNADEKISMHIKLSEEKDRKIIQILFISGPTILLFLLISVVLFSIIIVRQQNETDKKINALKKYTYSEIEETKVALLKKFRKRLKKMGSLVNKNKQRIKSLP